MMKRKTATAVNRNMGAATMALVKPMPTMDSSSPSPNMMRNTPPATMAA